MNVRKSIKSLNTKQQLVSEYFERDFDDAICKIVYHAYRILCKVSKIPPRMPSSVKDSIDQLEVRYHTRELKVTGEEYQAIKYKSIYVDWKLLVDFSWQVIQQQYGLTDSKDKYNPQIKKYMFSKRKVHFS